jgi:hypothetical protein
MEDNNQRAGGPNADQSGEFDQTRNSEEAERRSRVRGRPFEKGNAGRPRGAKNHSTRLLQALVDGAAEDVVSEVVSMARGRDPACMKMVMDRCLPVRKGQPIQLDLPQIKTVEDVINAMISVWNALGEGQLTPDEVAVITLIMDRSIKIIELLDITNRISALEAVGKQLK